MSSIDPEDSYAVAQAFGISNAMAREIMFLNDEHCDDWKYVDVVICGPTRPFQRHERRVRVPDEAAAEKRWAYMREWATKNFRSEKQP